MENIENIKIAKFEVPTFIIKNKNLCQSEVEHLYGKSCWRARLFPFSENSNCQYNLTL